MHPYQGQGICNQGICHSLELYPGPFSLRADTLSSEPNQLGHKSYFSYNFPLHECLFNLVGEQLEVIGVRGTCTFVLTICLQAEGVLP